MKKEWLLFIISGTVTLGLALVIIRLLAPGLLGLPVDLQLVQVDKKIPPFFENIFRDEDHFSKDYLIQDPITKVRAKPFYPHQLKRGPHDLMGFRNHYIPNFSDILVVGDSQTYGNNEPIDFNWPSVVQRLLKNKRVQVYNMSVGGWGAIQYYSMFRFARLFQPKVVLIAFYTGNDPIDSFSLAYNSENWKEFRQEPNLSLSGLSKGKFPAPSEEQWEVTFRDGIKTVFTPKLRLTSNQDHPAIHAGYQIMATVAEKITSEAKSQNLPVLFTIIPTKELVFEKKITQENIRAPEEYIELVENEKKNINLLKEKILSLEDAHYVDLLGPLQNEAISSSRLYREDANGHPIQLGYFIIGNTVAKYIDKFLPYPAEGFYYIDILNENKLMLIFAKNNAFWLATSKETAISAGWDPKKKYPRIKHRDIAGYAYKGTLEK